MIIPFKYQKDHKCCQVEKQLDLLCVTHGSGGRSYEEDISSAHGELSSQQLHSSARNQIPAGCPPVRDASRGFLCGSGEQKTWFSGLFSYPRTCKTK